MRSLFTELYDYYRDLVEGCFLHFPKKSMSILLFSLPTQGVGPNLQSVSEINSWQAFLINGATEDVVFHSQLSLAKLRKFCQVVASADLQFLLITEKESTSKMYTFVAQEANYSLKIK